MVASWDSTRHVSHQVNGVSLAGTYLLRVGSLSEFFFVRRPQLRRASGLGVVRGMGNHAENNGVRQRHHKLDSGPRLARWA